MANRTVLKNVSIKQDDGSLSTPTPIGATFMDVIDSRPGFGQYSLAQFFDNYMDFMKNTTFVYRGENKPQNKHIGIWLDTSVDNGLDKSID